MSTTSSHNDGQKEEEKEEEKMAEVAGPGVARARGNEIYKGNENIGIEDLLRKHRRYAVAVILRGTRAVQTYQRKDGTIVSRPDFKTRQQAAETVLAYVEGEPVKRQQTQSVSSHVTLAEIGARAAKSPALLAAMRRVLEIQAAKNVPSDSLDTL